MDKNFDVFAMAESYAEDNNLQGVDGLFDKPQQSPQQDNVEPDPEQEPDITKGDDEIPVQQPPKDDSDDNTQDENDEIKIVSKDGHNKTWAPDPDLVSDMKEISYTPVTYTRDDLITKEEDLRNIVDDDAIEEARKSMDDMSRKLANIEDAKHRHGIKHLQIPEGEIQTRILIAASDPSYKVAKEKLDEIFNMIKVTYPNFIYEWEDDYKKLALDKEVERIKSETPDTVVNEDDMIRVEELAKQNLGFDKEHDPNAEGTDPAQELKIIIDKSNLKDISWNKDELDKIKKSRSIELNIVESSPIEFSQIDDAPDNMIDIILNAYNRKTNDVTASLPASKYRCTFTGLSYPEVLDLSNSTEMDNIDGERKKWTICFNHIKNQSIGQWEEYQLYIDPETNREVKIGLTDPIPDGIDENTVHVVSRFEDFLRKTSYADLDFMLWKIICATAMDEEIITVDCSALLPGGSKCGKSYDWVYRPAELLQMSSIDPSILEDMEKTAKASSKEEILEIYNSSLLNSNSTITLQSSGFVITFGHISAYEYLSEIYTGVEALQQEEDMSNIISRGFNYIILTIIKSILLPQGNGRYTRVTGVRNLVKILNNLNEIDWLTLQKLVNMVSDPYEFRYVIKDLVCPHCKNISNIVIDDMSNLLFIVTQSLSSVDVTFKRV